MDTAGSTTQTQQRSHLNELKEIVSATLEKKGILAKTQAKLRKHVFEALSLREQQDKETYQTAPQIDENDANDQFAMALIRDFLSYHHLDYTLSLMNTEIQKKMDAAAHITRNEIASRLGLGAQKPTPDTSLLKLLVAKTFDDDVLKPRNSTLSNEVKLKPRNTNDLYRTPPTTNTAKTSSISNGLSSTLNTKTSPKSVHSPAATMDDLESLMASVTSFGRDRDSKTKSPRSTTTKSNASNPEEDRTVIDNEKINKYTNPLYVSTDLMGIPFDNA